MPWKKAEAIILSQKQQEILSTLDRRRTIAPNLRKRAEIILLSSEDVSTNQIRIRMGIDRNG